MRLVILPRNPDDTVALAVHDFTKPGQPSPWRVKMTRSPGSQQADILAQLGGLAQQQGLQGGLGQQQQWNPNRAQQNAFIGALGIGFPFR